MRKLFICVLLLAMSVPAAAAPAGDKGLFDKQVLHDRVLLLREHSPMENNIVAITSADGLIVIDTTGSPVTAQALRREIADHFKRKDFRYVINSHHHWDHSWGNQAFSDTTIIGHESCAGYMAAASRNMEQRMAMVQQRIALQQKRLKELPAGSNDPDLEKTIAFNQRNLAGWRTLELTPPDITFSERMCLRLSDLTIEMVYFGPAHSGSDILIYVPELELLVTGDLFIDRDYLPLFCGMDQVDVECWLTVLNAALSQKKAISHVVTGHKDLWTREKLSLWRDYIKDTWRQVRQAVTDGWTLQQAQERILLPDACAYLNQRGFSANRLARFQRDNILCFWRQLKPSAAKELGRCISSDGPEAAVAWFRELGGQQSRSHYIAEAELNQLGYALLGQSKHQAAIAVFTAAVAFFPQAWNLYDSLGEAYMRAGKREAAIRNYRKSLELNPDNINGRRMLEQLRQGS